MRTPFAPLPAQAASVSAIPAQQVGGVAQRGFDVLMLMAACQSQLRTHLLSPVTLATAMASVNADLHQRTETSKFVTLIAGILDTDRRAEELVDAGHGLCVYAPDESQPRRIETTPGFLLGVVETADREIHELRLQPGSSLVLFSDGAVEQTNPDGDQHGIEGVLTSSTGASGREPVVKRPLESVR
ncbi:MAG: PP2C family protein-serine/threonine phosphatase [Phycisphaerales bacterium]